MSFPLFAFMRDCNMSDEFHYGGQAVIEGVMMRGRRHLTLAVRRPNGQVMVATRRLPTAYIGKVRKIPFLRGVFVLVETMILGIQTLFQSANYALEEQDEEISPVMLWGVLAASIGFAVAIFFLAPLFITHFIDPHLGSSLTSNIVEGVIRMGMFILYLGLINLIPDIRRVFAYHGAEHKTVNAYEGRAPLEPAAVSRYSTAHVRCGTSFLFAVLVISIVVFALLGQPDLWLRVISRIVLIPVIAAIGYEFTRFSARYADNRVLRVLFMPGLALQMLTTRQPTEDQLEVAISALKGVVEADAAQDGV
jgi:uncharacterized protein YqhQ